MTYEEFRLKTLKVYQKKKHYKVHDSYGIKDAYRWSIKNKLIDRSITEKVFRIIIGTINKHLQDQLLQGKDVVFPERMGRFEIRKYNTYISLEDNKIKTNLLVDWDKTLKLWFEDAESYNNKTIIRHESKELFKFYYNKSNAIYNNKAFYEFIPTRVLKKRLKEIINNEGFDAFLTNI